MELLHPRQQHTGRSFEGRDLEGLSHRFAALRIEPTCPHVHEPPASRREVHRETVCRPSRLVVPESSLRDWYPVATFNRPNIDRRLSVVHRVETDPAAVRRKLGFVEAISYTRRELTRPVGGARSRRGREL